MVEHLLLEQDVARSNRVTPTTPCQNLSIHLAYNTHLQARRHIIKHKGIVLMYRKQQAAPNTETDASHRAVWLKNTMTSIRYRRKQDTDTVITCNCRSVRRSGRTAPPLLSLGTFAAVAELADATDSKSVELIPRVGSSPTGGTMRHPILFYQVLEQ